MSTLGTPQIVRDRAPSDLKTQATALSFHSALSIIGAATLWYVLKSYWMYAILSAGVGYLLYRWPRYTTWAVLFVVTPLVLKFLWSHMLLSFLTVGIAVLAYAMADESKRQQLHATATELYEPFLNTMSTLSSNVGKTASNLGEKTATVTRRTVNTAREAGAQ